MGAERGREKAYQNTSKTFELDDIWNEKKNPNNITFIMK